MGIFQRRLNGEYASARMTMPRARSEDLVIEELDNEVLVYDATNQRAHCLGLTVSRVWRACDGSRDAEALADTLDLASDEVREALEQLEASQLLEDNGLKIVDGTSGGSRLGSGLTRRQFTKVGAAAVATPMIYSVVVNTPMAAATPIPFQCEIFSTGDCGASSGCGSISGCCCCCSGNGSCKTCGSAKFCALGTQPCSPQQGGGFGTKCSDAKGTNPPTPQGCCGVDNAGTNQAPCGCGFGPYAGCCHPSDGTTCTPSSTDTNCMPCCNGQLLTSGSALGCCKSATVNCCSTTLTPSQVTCCSKSTQTTDCCGSNPPACCATNSCP